MKFSVICKKFTGIGLVPDILYLKFKKIIKTSRLFSKIVFVFHRGSDYRPRKTYRYHLKGVTFYPETEYDAVFFFDRSFGLVTQFRKIW